MSDAVLTKDESAGHYRLMRDGAEVGYVEYDRVGEYSILIKHTEVAAEHEGQGLGALLVSGVLDDVRRQGKTVIPICPYALNYIRKHRDYIDVVHADMRSTI
ncbi:MAG TPA: GNAT family N-acetyltransferase [Burkholderiaceae bacterium]|nr:GNAT family N-acetyltransferase [Burkholderiaceae bacterium]